MLYNYVQNILYNYIYCLRFYRKSNITAVHNFFLFLTGAWGHSISKSKSKIC